jgi:hypothetical protein
MRGLSADNTVQLDAHITTRTTLDKSANKQDVPERLRLWAGRGCAQQLFALILLTSKQ